MTKVDIMPSLQPTGRWRAWLLLVLILLAFFAFWLWDLGYPSLSGDEAFIANLAPRSTGEILQRLNSDEPHPPLYYLLMHGWSSVVGMRPEFNVRLPSLFLGLLLLSLTYRLARDLGLGRYSALLPTVMLGFFPHVVVHLREARMYSLMLASLAFMLVIALRFERLPRRLNVLIMATERVKPGQTLELVLYWQTSDRVSQNYNVFTYLLNAEGAVVAQQDNAPARGTYPTLQWQSGEIVVDAYELALPPDLLPGDYPLEFGLYDWMTGVRLLTESGADHVLLPVKVHVE